MIHMLDSFVPAYKYCEHHLTLISQPMNFLSCIVFWLAAVWLWTRVEDDDEHPTFNHTASIFMFILGLTGMAWHVTSHPVALALDMFVLFLMFIVVAAVLCNDVLRWSLVRGLVVVIMLLFMGALLKDASFLPQNAGVFLPILFFLALASLKAQTVDEKVAVYLLSAAYTLFIGLVAYCLDGALCGYFPQGLHFIWHIMLALSLTYISRTLTAMKRVPPPAEKLPEEQSPVQG